VLGLGVTGQLHVQLAKARGASPVIGITRSAEKRDLAQELGADLTIPGGDGAIEKVREATEGRGADVIIETTGVVPSLAAAVKMARAGGRLLLFGIITAKEGALPFYDLYFKELSLINARVAKSEDYPSSIALVERGLIQLDPLVSNVMPLDELKPAIEMLGSDNAQRMKIILEHGFSRITLITRLQRTYRCLFTSGRPGHDPGNICEKDRPSSGRLGVCRVCVSDNRGGSTGCDSGSPRKGHSFWRSRKTGADEGSDQCGNGARHCRCVCGIRTRKQCLVLGVCPRTQWRHC
jgi:hypothetical protein